MEKKWFIKNGRNGYNIWEEMSLILLSFRYVRMKKKEIEIIFVWIEIKKYIKTI